MAEPKPPREPRACDRPGCPNRFIPRHGRHVYCSDTCKKRCFNYRFALKAGR